MNSIIRDLARVLPNEIVFGESFRRAKQTLAKFNASTDKIDFAHSYQHEKLKNILAIAAEAPFYQFLKENAGFETIPFLNKEIILASFNDLIISKKSVDYITTGGTSGKPLGFYINKDRKGFEWFWMTNNWSKVGFSLKDYRAVLRNNKLNGKNYKLDRLLREYQYNNFSLNTSYLNFIVDHINLMNLKFLHAYPSAAYMLAKHLKSHKKQITIKTFLCGSENIFNYQKDLIQNTLNIRMYTWYGHSEKVILAGESKTCENYHSNPFYGYTEIIDENNRPIHAEGKVGELVGTGFINTKMPFLRYRTGDFAEYVGEVCPVCGHIGLTFKDVKGRWQGDKIYKSDGSCITTTALNLHNSVYNYIKGLQYYQNKKGELQVRVIPENNYSDTIRMKILKELETKSGKTLNIEVVEVEAMEYSINNKFQLLIQEIKNEL